ncbi:MAG: hypothetical protein C0618_04245 [Desulfuromonas sp.]|nr:MAG: hypothetical protein C0618_04245 [Desulfuromonas sp.]
MDTLSSEARGLLEKMQDGHVLWFSDAGDYPDRFWLENGSDQGGQQVNVALVTELQKSQMIEPVSGDSYRQRWGLVSGEGE